MAFLNQLSRVKSICFTFTSFIVFFINFFFCHEFFFIFQSVNIMFRYFLLSFIVFFFLSLLCLTFKVLSCFLSYVVHLCFPHLCFHLHLSAAVSIFLSVLSCFWASESVFECFCSCLPSLPVSLSLFLFVDIPTCLSVFLSACPPVVSISTRLSLCASEMEEERERKVGLKDVGGWGGGGGRGSV